jgi:hypothetical protein
MTVQDRTVPVRFYSEFVDEWAKLSNDVRQGLAALLTRLQADPQNARAAGTSDVYERQGRDPIVAFVLPQGFVVYVTIRHKPSSPGGPIQPEPTSIDVLAVTYPQNAKD